jgi:hyperosmotically inducible protein
MPANAKAPAIRWPVVGIDARHRADVRNDGRFHPQLPEVPMKTMTTLTALALAAALGLGGLASPAQAQTTPSSDHAANMAQAGSDAWITTKVKTELATTKGVPSTDISVETVDGVVTLTGVLPSKLAVKKAVAAAKSIKGVKSVDDSGLKVK